MRTDRVLALYQDKLIKSKYNFVLHLYSISNIQNYMLYLYTDSDITISLPWKFHVSKKILI